MPAVQLLPSKFFWKVSRCALESAVNTGTKTFTLATVTTGQQGIISGSGAYWNSSLDLGTVGGNLLKIGIAAISTSEVFVGDMVFTAATGTPTVPIACGYIVKIESTTSIWVRVFGTVSLANWAAGNKLTYNKVAVALTVNDKLYVPFIDTMCTTGSVGAYSSLSSTLIYSTDISTLARVRQYKAIQPFEANPSIGITGVSADAVRTADSIAT